MKLTYIKQGSEPVGDGGDQYTGLDRFGRVIDQRWIKDSSGAALERVQYGFDRASNRVWRKNVVATTGQDEFYRYDGLYQLTELKRGTLDTGKTGISGTPSWEEDFAFDPTGNWNNYVNKVNGTTNLDQNRTHTPVNEIGTIDGSDALAGFDAAGNMTKAPQVEDWGSANTLIYDAWNRLVEVKEGSATIGEYAYDGQHRRTTKVAGTTTRHYYYTPIWQIVEERTGTSTSAERQFVWGQRYLDDLILRDRGSERLYSLQDVFSCTAVTDSDGAVQERYGYDAFGLSRVMTPSFAIRASSSYDWETRYDNYRYDSESEFYQVRFRYLHPTLGRWMSRDPIGYKAGVNFYAYCLNTSINLIDILGLSTATFKFVGKSYIMYIGTAIGTAPTGGSQAALNAFAAATDLSYSETVFTDARDGLYRLYSERTFDVSCDSADNLTYTGHSLDTDSGYEPYRNSPYKAPPLTVVSSSSSKTTSVLTFSWKIRGRPDPIFEFPFTAVSTRTCWFIWHQVDGTVTCKSGTPCPSASISGSAFPTHELYINNVSSSFVPQGPFSGLWICSSKTPIEIL
jgi:RHS repeat-associated protein